MKTLIEAVSEEEIIEQLGKDKCRLSTCVVVIATVTSNSALLRDSVYLRSYVSPGTVLVWFNYMSSNVTSSDGLGLINW